MKLKCCIIDDEPLALELLESYIKKTSFLELAGKFFNAIEATDFVSNGGVDLLFLDIQMPELNGIEFSHIIQSKCRIIFTTAFSDYALEGFKINALDYLLKPISYQDFLQSSQRALEWFQMAQKNPSTMPPESIFVKSGYRHIQLELQKIQYIEGLKDYIKIYLEGENNPVVSLMSMKNIEELLPKNDFIRVHRSFIVRGDKIKIIERNRIIFGKVYIPISDTHKSAFTEFISRRSIFPV